MYVCACRNITDRTVAAAIATGARTVEEICRLCSAGGRCGGCWPVLERLLAQQQGSVHNARDDRIAV